MTTGRAMYRLRYICQLLTLMASTILAVSCKAEYAAGEMEEVETVSIATENTVRALLLDSFYIALAFIAVTIGIAVVVHLLRNDKWNTLWNWIESKLTLCFIMVWTLGFCVYSVGMYINVGMAADGYKLWAVAWMAVIHAFEMFLLESDISAVHESFHNNLFYMSLFSIAHFAASLVSLLFVIKHFGYNIIAALRLWLTSLLPIKKENLYIFWGMNRASYMLAKDIRQNAKDTHRILFVKTADEEEATGNRTGLDRLFHFLSIKNKELKELKELNSLSTNAFMRLSKYEIAAEKEKGDEMNILRDKLGVRSIIRLLGKTTSHVHILMLGDDEESNVKAANNLSYDKDLRQYAENHNVTIYCHARYDSVNRVLETISYASKLDIQIVDSAHMAIEILKSDDDALCMPVGYAKVEHDATVSSQFRSAVIGMGQCGRDAVRFLYEYGAFARSGNTKGTDSSMFQCDVFDKNMSNIAPMFRNSAAGADISETLNTIAADKCHKINLYDADCQSKLFADYMEKNISELNYIVISIKNDEEALALAVRLMKQAIAKGADMERFRIFVRSYNNELLNYMEKIVDHYNDSVVKALGLANNKQPLYIFGKISDLYTWHNIIDDNMRKESYRYYNSYQGNNETEQELGTEWKNRRKETLGKEMPYGYGALNEVRRMEHEDMENAWHRKTKIHLILKALGNDHGKLREFATAVSRHKRKDADNTYGISAEWQQIMDTLAQTEHLRWNASHEMMGYRYDENVEKKKRDILMRHNCLTAWDNLTTTTQGYDYKVVETSLKMWMEEIEKQ